MAFGRALTNLLKGKYGDDLSDEVSRQTGGRLRYPIPSPLNIIEKTLGEQIGRHGFFSIGAGGGIESEASRVVVNPDFFKSVKETIGRQAQRIEPVRQGVAKIEGALAEARSTLGMGGKAAKAVGIELEGVTGAAEGAAGRALGSTEGVVSAAGRGLSTIGGVAGKAMSWGRALKRSMPNVEGLAIAGAFKAATDVLEGKTGPKSAYTAGWRLTEDITPGYEGKPGEITGASKYEAGITGASTTPYKGETGQGRFGDERTTKEWLSGIAGGIRGVIRPAVQRLVEQGYTPKEARKRLRSQR